MNSISSHSLNDWYRNLFLLLCITTVISVDKVSAQLTAPVLISPLNNKVSVSSNSVTFQWNAVTDATVYRFTLSTSPILANPIVWDTTVTNTSKIVTGLQPGVKYYWRVRAKRTSDGTTSSWSETRNFITELQSPILTYPANNALNINLNSVTFQWNAVTDATVYRFTLSTSPILANPIVWDTTVTNTSKIVTGLQPGVKYYWRVRAKRTSDGTTSSWSETRNFITELQSPILTYPTNNDPHTGLNFSLQWNSVTGANVYRVRVGTDSTLLNPMIFDTNCTSNSKQLTNLSPNTTYYWRVRAKNTTNGSGSIYSPTWKFTTESAGNAIVSDINSENTLIDINAKIRIKYAKSTDNALTINCDLPRAGMAQFLISDINGKTVYRHDNAVEQGENTLVLSAEFLPTGIYTVSLIFEGHSTSVSALIYK